MYCGLHECGRVLCTNEVESASVKLSVFRESPEGAFSFAFAFVFPRCLLLRATKWHESGDKNDRKPPAFINNKPPSPDEQPRPLHFPLSLFLLGRLVLFLDSLFMLPHTRGVIYERSMSPTTHQTLSRAIVSALTMQLKKRGKKKRVAAGVQQRRTARRVKCVIFHVEWVFLGLFVEFLWQLVWVEMSVPLGPQNVMEAQKICIQILLLPLGSGLPPSRSLCLLLTSRSIYWRKDKY